MWDHRSNVIIIGTDPLIGASNDVDGNFRIENVPIGRQSIKVSYMGYEDSFVSEIQVGSGKEIVLNIQLKEIANQLNDVIVVAKPLKDQPLNSMATVSARSFTVEEASRYAGSFSDPGRMASAFAGVVSNNSFTNEIKIRGNSPTGLLRRLEGVEIPTPNHLSGYTRNGGVVTVLSPNAMNNSDFMTGAFPYISYDQRKDDIVKNYQFGILPNILYRIVF
ncbi:MAG: carboxypeptidase-like regulatory domain-containing protein [Flammeovirgaceae bacterium]|nr:carboxypeptidase-like regulatory domain-containing protein [Flammeovirgaceae bacterium]